MERLLANVHAADQPIFEGVNVLHHSVHEHFSGEIAHDLMNAYRDPAIAILVEARRIDMRIDHAPLPGPIRADAFMAVDYAALHAIGPDNIGLHRGQSAVEVA